MCQNSQRFFLVVVKIGTVQTVTKAQQSGTCHLLFYFVFLPFLPFFPTIYLSYHLFSASGRKTTTISGNIHCYLCDRTVSDKMLQQCLETLGFGARGFQKSEPTLEELEEEINADEI